MYSECPDGTYGQDCMEICMCIDGSVSIPECDIVTGRCNCLPQYTGINCEGIKTVYIHMQL